MPLTPEAAGIRDADKPIGYWVQQRRSDGETIAVKVLFSHSVSVTPAAMPFVMSR
jgi:hypothetical protein